MCFDKSYVYFSNFHPPEFMRRDSETQLKMGANFLFYNVTL